MGTLTIDRQAIVDLMKLTNELNDRVESIELMSDPEFMKSLKISKEQIKNREFANWNEL